MVNLAPISEVLSQTLNDNLRRPLQPAGLFAAALLVLLNTVLIYPLLLTIGQPVAVYVRDLETGWQAVLLAAFVLTLSYLLLGISATILKIFTGELWSNSWLGDLFWKFQRRRWVTLYPGECENAPTYFQSLNLKDALNTIPPTLSQIAVQPGRSGGAGPELYSLLSELITLKDQLDDAPHSIELLSRLRARQLQIAQKLHDYQNQGEPDEIRMMLKDFAGSQPGSKYLPKLIDLSAAFASDTAVLQAHHNFLQDLTALHAEIAADPLNLIQKAGLLQALGNLLYEPQDPKNYNLLDRPLQAIDADPALQAAYADLRAQLDFFKKNPNRYRDQVKHWQRAVASIDEFARLVGRAYDERRETYHRLVTEYVQCQQKQWHFRNRFPVTEGQLAPTGLGNVINAAADQIWQHYRMDMAALWPFLDLLLAEKDITLRERIQNERATLDFLLNAAFVMLVFALEFALFGFLEPKPWLQVGIVLGAVVLALGVFYPAAVDKAFSWSQTIQMAFDRHQTELASALGLKPAETRAEARENWARFSRWLKTGTQKRAVVQAATQFPFDDQKQVSAEWPEDHIFRGGVTPRPGTLVQIQSLAPNLNFRLAADYTQQVAAPGQALTWPAQPGPAALLYTEEIAYTILLEQTYPAETQAASWPANDVLLLVYDPRIAWIGAPPTPTPAPAGWDQAAPQADLLADAAGAPNRRLLWRLNAFPSQGGRALHYRLPKPLRAAVVSEPDCEVRFGAARQKGFEVQVRNPTANPVGPVWLYVVDERPAGLDERRQPSTSNADSGSRISVSQKAEKEKNSVTISAPVEALALAEGRLNRSAAAGDSIYRYTRILLPEIAAHSAMAVNILEN